MKTLDKLIDKFKEVQEELNKNVNGSYAAEPNQVQMSEKLVMNKNGQWGLEKGAALKEKPNMGHSTFTMDHVNQVAAMKDHGEAKKHAHAIVDASSANPANKAKMKLMINKSKSPAHLAQGMSNHVLAHPSEGLKVVKND